MLHRPLMIGLKPVRARPGTQAGCWTAQCRAGEQASSQGQGDESDRFANDAHAKDALFDDIEVFYNHRGRLDAGQIAIGGADMSTGFMGKGRAGIRAEVTVMADHTTDFEQARLRVRAALAEMGAGNPQPYIDCWASSQDVTLFGAWGPIERGLPRLTDTFRWVGTRFKRGALVPDDVVSFESGDLAYTVGFERGDVVVDGGAPVPMTIRVTHVYRRIDGQWRLMHRHADFPPADQRKG